MKNLKEKLTEIVKRYKHDTRQRRKVIVQVKLSYEGIGSITYLKGRTEDKDRKVFENFNPLSDAEQRVHFSLEDTTTGVFYITDKDGIIGEPYNKHGHAYVPYRESDLDLKIIRPNKEVYRNTSHNLGHGGCVDSLREYSNYIAVDFLVADADVKECLDCLLEAAGVEHALI
jgi:hypothetical protein